MHSRGVKRFVFGGSNRASSAGRLAVAVVLRRGHLSCRCFAASGPLRPLGRDSVLVPSAYRGSALALRVLRTSPDRLVRFRVAVAVFWRSPLGRWHLFAAPLWARSDLSGRIRHCSVFSARVARLVDWLPGPACLPLATRWRRPRTRRSVHRRRFGFASSTSLPPVSGSSSARRSALLCVVSDAAPASPLGAVYRFDGRLLPFAPVVLVLASGALGATTSPPPSCFSRRDVLGLIAVSWRSFSGPVIGRLFVLAAHRFGASRTARVSRSSASEAPSFGCRLGAFLGRDCGPVPLVSSHRCAATSVLLATARLQCHLALFVPPLGAALPGVAGVEVRGCHVVRPSSSPTWWVRF